MASKGGKPHNTAPLPDHQLSFILKKLTHSISQLINKNNSADYFFYLSFKYQVSGD